MKSRNARYTGNGLFAAVKAVSIFDGVDAGPLVEPAAPLTYIERHND